MQRQICNTLTARYNGAQTTGNYIIENQFDAQRLNQIGIIDKDSEATRIYSTRGLARTIKNGGGMGAKPDCIKFNHIIPDVAIQKKEVLVN